MSTDSINSTPLPQDVIEAIVEMLEDDHDAMQRSSLVSTTFHIASQRRLFRSIVVRSAQSCQRLVEILTNSPIITPYIKELSVRDSFFRERSFWPLSSMHLPVLFRQISTNGYLRLFHFVLHRPIDWEHLSDVQESLFTLVKAPTIDTIRIEGAWTCNFPLNILATTLGLRNLGFIGSASPPAISQPPVLWTVLNNTQTYLETLTIGNSSSPRLATYLTSEHCPLDISRVRGLHIHGSSKELLETSWEMIVFARTTLNSLSWDYRYPLPDENNPLKLFGPTNSLRIIENLTHFSFFTDIMRIETTFSILVTIDFPDTIQIMNVILYTKIAQTGLMDSLSRVFASKYADKCLLEIANQCDGGHGRALLPRLRQIGLHFLLPSPVNRDLLKERVKKWFSQMYTLGITTSTFYFNLEEEEFARRLLTASLELLN